MNTNINSKENKHCIIIEQSLNTLRNLYNIDRFHEHVRSWDHRTRSNNWLKLHGNPMRRKPFKQDFLLLDEWHNCISPCGRQIVGKIYKSTAFHHKK